MNEPANVWVTHAPFVWLPAVLVFTAILGHILVFRRLAAEARLRTRFSAPRTAVNDELLSATHTG